MADAVLDASAVLALLANEPGSERVRATLGAALMSSVNLAEVLAKLGDHGVPEAEQRRICSALDLEVGDFDADSAWSSARLRTTTKVHGLSLGDRACLALALARSLPVLTADRRWSELAIGVEVTVIR